MTEYEPKIVDDYGNYKEFLASKLRASSRDAESLDTRIKQKRKFFNKLDKIGLVLHAIYFANNNHEMFLKTKVMQETLYTENDIDDLIKDIVNNRLKIDIKAIE